MNKEISQQQQNAADREMTRGGVFFRPSVDIMETAEELIVRADVPGASPESISLNYEREELTLHVPVGQRQSGETRYVLQEYGVGDYHRQFLINEEIESEQIHADYSDGVLTIHMPKAAAAKPKKIEVHAH